MITPVGQYIYGEEVKTDTGVVTTSELADTKQRFKVLAIGKGWYEHNNFVVSEARVGDIVIIQKHAAEGDTPPHLLNDGFALFLASRVMAVERE